MEIKNEGEGEDVVLDELPVVADGAKDETDWKAEALKRHGIAKRFQTKADKLKGELAKAKPADEKKTDATKKDGEAGASVLDRIDKAVLRAEKITAQDEVELVETIKKETGKSVEDVLESNYFKSELKALREANATKDATPSGTKRSTTGSKDSVDYWLAKGELPPMDQPELRRKVVNAKMAKEKGGNTFSSNPIS